MAAQPSPQFQAVGETSSKPTYASFISSQAPAQSLTKTQLKSIEFNHGEPTIKFTMEEIAQYIVEEGLHQALVLKFSYGQPDTYELRKLIPKILGVKGQCLIGRLARRHILIRFDKYDDYVLAAARFVNYLHYNGEDCLFRVFPWCIGFNPKEETSRAFTWISLPNLPPELFAKRSLLSIASAVGKPIAIDKATQEKSRPSTARVKVELDLLDKHPNHIRVQYMDEKTGKVMEHVQEFVFDNLPLFCSFCKHQGHEEKSCRLMLGNNRDNNQNATGNNVKFMEQYQGDAREILKAKVRANIANVEKIQNNGEDAVVGGKNNKMQLVVDVNQHALAIQEQDKNGHDGDSVQEGNCVNTQALAVASQSDNSGQQQKSETDGTLGVDKGKNTMVHVEKGHPPLPLDKSTGICEPNDSSSTRIIEQLPLMVVDTSATAAELRSLVDASPVDFGQTIAGNEGVTAGSICADQAKAGDDNLVEKSNNGLASSKQNFTGDSAAAMCDLMPKNLAIVTKQSTESTKMGDASRDEDFTIVYKKRSSPRKLIVDPKFSNVITPCQNVFEALSATGNNMDMVPIISSGHINSSQLNHNAIKQGSRSLQVALNTSIQEIPSQDQDLLFEDNDTHSLFSSATKNKKWADLVEAEEEQEDDNIGDHDNAENSTSMEANTKQTGQHDCANQSVKVWEEQFEKDVDGYEREDGEFFISTSHDKRLALGRKSLSPNAPIFVPSKYSMEKHVSSASPTGQQQLTSPGAKMKVATRSSNAQKIISTDKELLVALVSSNSLAPINTSKQLQVGTSTFSPKILQGVDTFEKGEEDAILDNCFKNAARDADISPRQQRSGKSKNKNKTHGRNLSWDDKVSEEFVPRQLPMRQAKQKVAVPTTSTKSNRSKKN